MNNDVQIFACKLLIKTSTVFLRINTIPQKKIKKYSGVSYPQ